MYLGSGEQRSLQSPMICRRRSGCRLRPVGTDAVLQLLRKQNGVPRCVCVTEPWAVCVQAHGEWSHHVPLRTGGRCASGSSTFRYVGARSLVY